MKEKDYQATSNFRSLFPFSKSKFFTNSIKSVNKGFYEVLARFYLAKKFINNLRFFTSTRNLKYLTAKNLRMINDPIYFNHSDKVSFIKKFLIEYCFDPSSLFTLVSIFLNFLVTVFLFVYIPFAVCVFDEDLNNKVFLKIIKINCIVILLLDVLRKLNTAFYKKGLLVRSKSFIIKRYAKKYLTYDIFSIFPLILVEFVFTNKVSQIFLIFFYLKLKHFGIQCVTQNR